MNDPVDRSPEARWSGMGALGHARRGGDRHEAAAPGADKSLCPFPGPPRADRPGDAELITRFMRFRPEAARPLPGENLRILRALPPRRARIVEMRKRLMAYGADRRKHDIPADVEAMDDAIKAMPDTQGRCS